MQWGSTSGNSIVYFSVQFTLFRCITALHTCANAGYMVVENEDYWKNLGATMLKVYDTNGNSYPWGVDYMIMGI